jgi:hypothetical protein
LDVIPILGNEIFWAGAQRRVSVRVERWPLSFFALFIKQLFVSANDDTPKRRTMDLFDVEAAEKAEAQIDAFISKRVKEREDANKEAKFWVEQERHHRERRREENRQAWLDFYEHMNRLHLVLAAEHADKRSRLLAEGEYEPGENPDPEVA